MAGPDANARLRTFRNTYRAAFDEHLADGSELTLQAAYELGRDAVRRELGVLDLAAVHHDVLRGALARTNDPVAVEATTRGAEEFFLESLSAFEMVQRGYREAQETALLEQRNTAILRQLSSFLADASLALGAEDSLGEVIQLVAEHAREILGADCCTVTLSFIELTACSDGKEESPDDAHLVVSLTSLDERELGTVDVSKGEGEFSSLDEAVLVHLAQTASAAIERAQLYAQTTGR